MMALLTHYRPHAPSPWLTPCMDSAAAAISGLDAKHVMAGMYGDYTQARWDGLQLCEFVGFLDDDDTIEPHALKACHEALVATGAGVAFTKQAVINERGERLTITPVGHFTRDIAAHPQSCHHFALIRRDALAPEVLEHAQRIGLGFDWLAKAHAALKHGAVHVNTVGYNWRRYPEQDSVLKHERFKAVLPDLRTVTAGWLRGNKPIPRYEVTQC